MSGGFTPVQRIAVFVVGIVGVLIPGLQPQLLGALAAEGRVGESLLGHVATAELLAMGIAAGGAGWLLPIARLRAVAAIAIAAAVVLDVMTPGLAAAPLIAVRALAGLAEGVLIWIAIGLIVRSSEPARWSGLYLATQTLAQFAVAALLGYYAIPVGGSAFGFRVLGAVTALGLLALPWLPRWYAELVHETDGALPPIPARGFVALAGVLVYLAFTIAVWVYVEPLAHERGVSPAAVASIAPLSLAMQVVGAGVATMLAGRLPTLPTLVIVGAADLLLLAVMGAPPSAGAFLVASSAFGFLWLFALPFQVPAVIAADPSRRAAALIGGAQLVGSSVGPFVAALLVGNGAIGRVLWFGATCVVVALVLLTAAAGRRAAPA